ncbi:MAG: T9SS type A sorting domain-containing protein, partial [Saprospiraceae bacterium]|nr:T9SS type A sorting domain-containing protein [Saprospiraceae bacterium]
NGFVTDSISFGALKKDESFSRCPNGTGSFEISKPTFNAENCKTTSVTYEINNDVEIFPNPANDRLYFRNSGKYSDLSDILIADIHGRIVKNVMNMSLSDGLDISQLPPGFYLIKFNHAVSSLEPSIKKFIKQ